MSGESCDIYHICKGYSSPLTQTNVHKVTVKYKFADLEEERHREEEKRLALPRGALAMKALCKASSLILRRSPPPYILRLKSMFISHTYSKRFLIKN